MRIRGLRAPRAPRRARDPPDRRALDGLPARDLEAVARPRARCRRGARGGERDQLPDPDLAAHSAGHARAPRAPRPLRTGVGPKGCARRVSARDGPAAPPLPRLALPHHLAGRGARPRGARHPARLDRDELHRRGPRRLLARRRAGARAHPALPGALQALQAHRGAAGRARARARGPARDGRRRRPSKGDRGRDRRTRAGRPGAPARPRERGEEARAPAQLVGQPHRVVGRGLVPHGDGGRRLRHAERRAGGGRAARVDRRRGDGTARPRAGGAGGEDAAARARPPAARPPGRARTGARSGVHLGPDGARQPGGARVGGRGRRRAARPARGAAALRHRPRGRTGGRRDHEQRDRARLHDRLRPRARRRRLRLAGRPRVGVHHPDGPWLGAADRRGAGGVARGRVRGPARGRRRQAMAHAASGRHGGGRARGDPAAARARRGDQRRRGVGRGRGAAHGDAVDGALGRARRPPGLRALQAGGLLDHRRGQHAAAVRPRPRGRRTRRDRRVPRQRALDRRRWRLRSLPP